MGTARVRMWVIAVSAALAFGGACTPAARGSLVRVALTGPARTATIPTGFVGLAFEYSGLPQWVASEGPANPVLVRLIRNLDPVGRPSIRIGGLSTDHAWWPQGGIPAPRGVTYALSPSWADSARALAAALDAKLVLGVNLEANRLAIDRVEADEFIARIGRRWIGAMDIGNEPPLYSSVPWYRLLNGRLLPWYADEGRPVPGRGLTWGPLQFTNEYARVMNVLPAVAIAGPDTQQASWFATWVRLLSPHSRVRMLMSHGYGLNNCVRKPADPAYPSVPHLLSAFAARDVLAGLQRYVELAHRDGATFRIDEMGSITCNGRWGVANTMASALWMTNALFTVARAGVDGVNLHSFPGLSNTLFDFSDSRNGWIGLIRPAYYGALLFADAAPAGSRLVTESQSGPSTVHAWATQGPGSAVHVVLINDSRHDGDTARLSVAPGSDPSVATLERLSAPSAYATHGITLGGRSFGEKTTSGVLAAPVSQKVVPHDGTYRLRLPSASAALLTFAVAGRQVK